MRHITICIPFHLTRVHVGVMGRLVGLLFRDAVETSKRYASLSLCVCLSCLLVLSHSVSVPHSYACYHLSSVFVSFCLVSLLHYPPHITINIHVHMCAGVGPVITFNTQFATVPVALPFEAVGGIETHTHSSLCLSLEAAVGHTHILRLSLHCRTPLEAGLSLSHTRRPLPSVSFCVSLCLAFSSLSLLTVVCVLLH